MTAPPSELRTRRLDALANDTGQFAILAMDHVASMAATLRPEDPQSVTADEMMASKAQLIESLAGHATGLLIDPGFLANYRDSIGKLSAAGGLILGIEDGDYVDVHILPRRLPGWTVAKAADLGADAVKISVYFDPNGDTAAAERFVADVVAECAVSDVPLFCEPLVLDGEPSQRRSSVLEGVKRFGALGPDVLKIQFPEGDGPGTSHARRVEACEEVDSVSPVPWTLLSEGADFDLFKDRLEIACGAGAAGFLGGRAVWADAVTGDSGIDVSASRLDQLSSIAKSRGRDWKLRMRPVDRAQGKASS